MIGSNDRAYHLGMSVMYNFTSLSLMRQICLGLYGQISKRIWWMPWRQQAKKGVVVCDNPRGAGKQALIRGFPNGVTRPTDNKWVIII